MGNVTDNTDDLNSYDVAQKKIKDYLNENSPKKKTGRIRKFKDYATELGTEIKKEESLNNILDNLQNSITEEKQELIVAMNNQADVLKQQSIVSEQKEVKSKKDKFLEIQNKVNELQKDYLNARKNFPGDIPTKESVLHNLSLCDEMNKYKTIADTYCLNNEENNRLLFLNEKFQEGEPTDNDFRNIRDKNKKLKDYRKIDDKMQLSEEEKIKLDNYKMKFRDDEHISKKISALQDLWLERVRKNEMLKQKQQALESMENLKFETEVSSKKNIPLIIGGLILLVIGVLTTGNSAFAGLLLSVLGIIFLIIGFIKKNSKTNVKNNNESKKESLKEDCAYVSKEIEKIDKEIELFFSKLDIAFDIINTKNILQQLMKDATIYESLLERFEKSKENNHVKECESLYSEIISFLEKYKLKCEEELEFADAINFLEREKIEFINLTNKKNNWSDANKEYQDKLNRIIEFINALNFIKENDIGKQLNNIAEQLNDYNNKKEIYDKEMNIKKNFEANNDVEKLMSMSYVDGETDLIKLNEMYESAGIKIDSIKEKLQFYKNQYNDVIDELDEIISKKEKLEELTVQIKNRTKKYEMMEKTQELLTIAKENLTSKYIGPLKNSFSKYYKWITENTAENYYIDANAKITVSELGMQREVSSFSEGYKDLIGFCLRLSFVDAMYKNEKPMIILDDPFVNLDKNKLEAGKRLLKSLENEYQVIYFTCNENR